MEGGSEPTTHKNSLHIRGMLWGLYRGGRAEGQRNEVHIINKARYRVLRCGTPGLTEIRDTVTEFNLFVRDLRHEISTFFVFKYFSFFHCLFHFSLNTYNWVRVKVKVRVRARN